MTMTTGYLIDPFACSVTEVEYPQGDLAAMYRLLSHESMPVDTIDAAYPKTFKTGDCVFVDDEGLHKGARRAFVIAGHDQALFGKGLMHGMDGEGNSIKPATPFSSVLAFTAFIEVGSDGTPIQTNVPWVKPMAPPHASEIEAKISMRIVDDALSAGFSISVYDGEETTIRKSRDKAEIVDAMSSTDTDTLTFHNADGKAIGKVFLVWGNDHDLISDNTDNEATNALLAGALKLSEAP